MKEFIKNYKKVWPYMKDEKKHIIGYILIALTSITVNIIVPIVSASVIVNLTENNLKQLVYMALILFCISMVKNLFVYLETY